jgi:3D (Asp-Asp-Asp) domain-containing protein
MALIGHFLLATSPTYFLSRLYTMNKYLNITIVLAIAILFSTTTTHAGFMDWVKGPADQASFMNVGIGSIQIPTMQTTATLPLNTVPKEQAQPKITVKAKAAYTVSVSAYSSTPDQTDDSPFITARNTYVRDGIVATNFLPFGTAIKIPAVYGDKIFIVEDRMNKRYTTNVDIWMADRQAALQFGRKNLVIEVL